MAHKRTLAWLLAGIVVGFAATAHAQNLNPQATLTGTVADSRFGISVDVDENVAVVGTATSGRAHVFTRSGATWSRVQQLQFGSESAFGRAVAVSGTTIAVGSPGGTGGGAVHIFERINGQWTATARLTHAGGFGQAFSPNFGAAVALEGATLVVGAWSADVNGASSAGRAFVFQRSGSTWTEQELVPSSARLLQDYYGTDVDISGDTVCVGSPEASGISRPGSVFVFTRGGGTWSQQQRLLGVTAAGGDQVGTSCAVDGDTVVGGAPWGLAAYVFTRAAGGTTWTQSAKLTGSGLTSGNGGLSFGRAVTIDGARIFVGAETAATDTGEVRSFTRAGNGSWVEGTIYSATGTGYRVGSSVAFDGQALIVGGPCPTAAGCAGVAGVFSNTLGPSGAPGAPLNFAASVAGSTVQMSWSAPASGDTPTGYTLLARASAGGPVLVSVPLGVATAFSTAAPNGVYVLSVQATNAFGTGPESAAVTVTVPASVAPPGAPGGFAASVNGSSVTFSWTPPASGGAVAGYTLLAGLTPGFTAPIASLSVPASATSLSVPGVPAGTYYARLIAQNSGGSSPASNEASLTVAGLTAPGAPTMNAPTVSGGVVSLSWTPGSGGVPASYVLTARNGAGAVLGVIPATGTALSVPNVPSGTYLVSVAAVNAAGTSGASNQVTVTVP